METLRGFIKHIVYRNDDNGYTVLNLEADAGEITCVGLFRYADEGEGVVMTGEYTEHPVYGKQFNAKSYEITPLQDIESMKRYLGSGAIKGVGEALAKRIVNNFGEDTFKIIEEDPERLSEIKGISAKMARAIASQFAEKQDMRKIMVFLQQYGISNSLSVKIFEQYGNRTYSIIKENPYMLADDIHGVGFKIADEIASKVGIHTDSDYRIRSGIMYEMMNSLGEGHCYLPKDMLIDRACALLDVPRESVDTQIMNQIMEKKLVLSEDSNGKIIYLKQYYHMERNCAAILKNLDITDPEPEEEIKRKLLRYCKDITVEPDELQIKAIISAVKHGVTILTGGPGTGKTTTINMMIRYLEAEGLDFYLTAPTGRAAKRMTETTGYDAATIQRVLHLQPASEDGLKTFSYEKNEENPLEADVIIVDEMSMVDLPLFSALLKAIMVGTRLIMVGDTNQLPSVGAGAVLRDLIASECFHVVELKKIFRQAEQSDIVLNAHRINAGEMIPLDNKSNDFFFLPRADVNHVMKNLVQLVSEKLPAYLGVNPYEVQVLTPMRKGALGVESLNPILQKYLNPPDKKKAEYERGDLLIREGDKVMQIKNNYQLEWEIRGKYGIPVDKGLGVFNGDMGTVLEINHYAEYVSIEYDEKRIVNYPFSGLDELELAYAVTIHKSQGSEYPAVVMPLISGPRMLFNRNLLYTAVTRAKRLVVVLGSADTIKSMTDNTEEQKRFTGLDINIKKAYEYMD